MTTNTVEWAKQFQKGVALVLQVNEKILKEAAQEFQKDVKERTPVGQPSLWKNPPHHDYVPGALRQSWTLSYEGNVAFVYNNRPYAYRVETGWSTQAPSGMMRLAVLDFPNIVDKLARKYKL